MYLAAMLRDRTFTTRVVDANLLGMNLSQTVSTVNSFKPDVLGVSTTFSSYKMGLSIAEKVKKHNPRCIIVFGGRHVSFRDVQVLNNRHEVDYVVRGEGEMAFRKLLDVLTAGGDLRKVPGLTFRNDAGKVIRNEVGISPDVNDLPYPEREFCNLEAYFQVQKDTYLYRDYRLARTASVLAGRGCPYKCIFCEEDKFSLVSRTRDPKDVVNEIELLQHRYCADSIKFNDNDISWDKTNLRGICEEILSRDLRFKWLATCRADELNLGLLQLMKRSGCIGLFLGGESGSQKMLNAYNKHLRLEKIRETATLIRKLGMRSVWSFILGGPEESSATLRETVRFIEDNIETFILSILTPHPGTVVFDLLESRVSDLRDMDLFDAAYLQRLWIREFCNIRHESLLSTMVKLRSSPKFLGYAYFGSKD